MSMGRFWLFAGQQGFSFGGFGDFAGTFKTIEGAKAEAVGRVRFTAKTETGRKFDWWHIVDAQVGGVVAAWNAPPKATP